MFINFISKFTFLHKLASVFVNIIPFFILHNISKYYALRKSVQIVKMDKIDGDYCEFGCFTGASLRHVLNLTGKNKFLKNKIIYGFDSFKGFPVEIHSEFKSEVFTASYEKVKHIEIKNNKRCRIIKGFFDEVLEDEILQKEITKISIAFIDCDLAISSKPVFKFIKTRLVSGSSIIIDDYYNIDLEGNSICKEFLKNFEINKNVFLFSTYGLGGVIFKYIKD